MVRLSVAMPDPFEIIVGTYEQYLLGYKVRNIVDEYKMEKSFATRSHSASVRCVGNSKHYLASGGADDSVYLYDMRYRVESGRLMHHNDTINALEFSPEASHLFTCSNDGSIAAIRCGNWQTEKHWHKAHKGSAVSALAIHPTGKLALSTGADGILRTWNLVKGRQVYATNLVPRLKLDAKNVTVLKWSPSGDKYLLAVNQRIDIYSVDVAGINDEIKCDSKIICVEFLRDDLIAVGLENGQIKLYDLEKSVETVQKLAHDIRVKCIAYKNDLLVTASSSGEIKLWKYSKDKLDMLHTVNCGARITCLTLATPCKNLIKKNEVKVEEESTVKKKKKFRLRQEVIIEDEDDEEKDKREDDDEDDVGSADWEVTPVDASVTPSSRMNKDKNRRSEVEEIDTSKAKKHKAFSSNPLKKKRTETPVRDQCIEAEAGDRPKKKKKKIISEEGANNDASDQKTEKRCTIPHEKKGNNKKVKKICDYNAEVTGHSNRKIKSKYKVLVQEVTDGTPPKKKKKKMGIEEGNVNLKKKKKQ